MTKCARCGMEYDQHDVDTSDDAEGLIRCRVNHVEEYYGFFIGGDPRQFRPDLESCLPSELEAHRKACLVAEQSDLDGNHYELECPSRYEQWGDQLVHVTRSSFGLGTGRVEYPQYYAATQEEADEHDERRYGGLDDE